MKIHRRLMAILLAISTIVLCVPNLWAQGKINAGWYHESQLVTETTTVTADIPPSPLGWSTYSVAIAIEDGFIRLERKSGGATDYILGPVAVNGNGTIVRFNSFLTDQGGILSEVGIENMYIDGLPLPRGGVWAGSAVTHASYEYDAGGGTHEINFTYSRYNHVGPYEGNLSVEILSVPEPATASLVGLGFAVLFIFRRRM